MDVGRQWKSGELEPLDALDNSDLAPIRKQPLNTMAAFFRLRVSKPAWGTWPESGHEHNGSPAPPSIAETIRCPQAEHRKESPSAASAILCWIAAIQHDWRTVVRSTRSYFDIRHHRRRAGCSAPDKKVMPTILPGPDPEVEISRPSCRKTLARVPNSAAGSLRVLPPWHSPLGQDGTRH